MIIYDCQYDDINFIFLYSKFYFYNYILKREGKLLEKLISFSIFFGAIFFILLQIFIVLF